MLIKILNGVFRVVEWIVDGVVNIFPASPLNWNYTVPEWARWMNALIPFQEMVSILAIYVTAVLVYYVVRVTARWIKMVGQ